MVTANESPGTKEKTAADRRDGRKKRNAAKKNAPKKNIKKKKK